MESAQPKIIGTFELGRTHRQAAKLCRNSSSNFRTRSRRGSFGLYMKKFCLSLLSIGAFAICASAQTPAAPAQPAVNADNTARNTGDAKKDVPTADQQPNNEGDRKLLQAIRKGVIDEKPLSMDAKNCKIIVANGMVTLRGPVDSDAEKKSITDIATRLAGNGKVKDELEVKAPKK